MLHLVDENFSITRYISLSRIKIVCNLFPSFPLPAIINTNPFAEVTRMPSHSEGETTQRYFAPVSTSREQITAIPSVS